MNKSYIPEIDVLRAVAVLSVMVCHLNASWLPGGFAGVDIFFVISGYVVTKSLLSRPTESVKTFIFDFYARRCLRLLPALVVVIGLTAIATILFIPDSWLSEAVERTGLYALFGLSNHALYFFDDGYFAPRSDYNPFTHTWSLGVEEQFYLLIPIVLFLFIRANSTKHTLTYIIGISVMAIISLVYAWWLSVTNPKAAYYLMPSRFWELAAGVLLALVHHSKVCGSTPTWLGRVALLLGTVSLAIGLIYTNPNRFPVPWAVAPVLGSTLMIHGILTADMRSMPDIVTGVMRNAVLKYIGRISYSLYLFHWPIFVLMRWTVGLESALYYFVAITVTFACAIVSYHIVEIPIRSLSRGGIRRNLILISGGIASLVSVFIFVGLFNNRDDLALTVTSDKSLWQARYTARQSEYVGEYFPNSTIFAIGDSHLGAYRPMIRWAADDLKMGVRFFPTRDCQLGRIFYRISDSPDCEKLVVKIINDIKASAKPGDIIFFAALRSHRLVNQWVIFDAEKISEFNASNRYHKRLREAAEQNEKYLQDFVAAGMHVLIDLPKPVLHAVPYRCADWFNKFNPICQNGFTISRARLTSLNTPMIETLRRLKETVPGLHLWDPFPLLCPGATCSAYKDGKPLFYDGDHISQYGNQVLYPYFRQELVDILASAIPSSPTR